MADEKGFVPIRRGIIAHVESANLSVDLFGAYLYMILKADHNSEIWMGSAARLAAAFRVCLTRAKGWLRELRAKDYIECEPGDGRHGAYPIKIKRMRSPKKQGGLFTADGGAHAPPRGVESSTSTHEDAPPRGVETPSIQEVSTTRREKLKSKAQAPFVQVLVPDELWQAFVEMRAKLRKPLTAYAAKLICRKLEDLKASGDDPVLVLEQSIAQGWQGVFPLRKENGNGTGTGETKHEIEQRRTLEACKRTMERHREQSLNASRPTLPRPIN